jgi:hypothetical protein
MQQAGWSVFRQQSDQVVLRIALSGLGATMENGRLVELACEPQVTAQAGDLRLARRETPVVVETRLAYCYNGWIGGELDNLRPELIGAFGHVGMDAYGSIGPKGPREFDRSMRRLQVVARRQDPFDAGVARRGEDVRSIGPESPRLEMAVAIY